MLSSQHNRRLSSRRGQIQLIKDHFGGLSTLQKLKVPEYCPAGCVLGLLVAFLLDGPESQRTLFLPFLTAAGLARSRPALCHVSCFVICYTNRRTFAQVLQLTIPKKKFMHQSCCTSSWSNLKSHCSGLLITVREFIPLTSFKVVLAQTLLSALRPAPIAAPWIARVERSLP
jgi:hypothetical protein